MDAQRFEALSRRFAADASRRGLLRAATGLAAGLLTLGHAGSGSARTRNEGIPIVHCRVPGKKCDSPTQCCSGACTKKGRCTCVKKGKQCWSPLEGALCCSQKCHGGKCA